MRSLCSPRLLPNSALRPDDRADSINPHPGHLSASAHAGDDPPQRGLPNYLRGFSRRPEQGIAGRCLPALFSPEAPKYSPRRWENAQKVARDVAQDAPDLAWMESLISLKLAEMSTLSSGQRMRSGLTAGSKSCAQKSLVKLVTGVFIPASNAERNGTSKLRPLPLP